MLLTGLDTTTLTCPLIPLVVVARIVAVPAFSPAVTSPNWLTVATGSYEDSHTIASVVF